MKTRIIYIFDKESYIFLSFIEKISFSLLSFDKMDYNKNKLFNNISSNDLKANRMNSGMKIKLEKKDIHKENHNLISVYVLMQILLLFYENDLAKLNEDLNIERKSTLTNLNENNSNNLNNIEKEKETRDFSNKYFTNGKDFNISHKNFKESFKFLDNNKLNDDVTYKERELREIKDSLDKYFENCKNKDLTLRKIEVDNLLPLLVSYNNEVKKK